MSSPNHYLNQILKAVLRTNALLSAKKRRKKRK